MKIISIVILILLIIGGFVLFVQSNKTTQTTSTEKLLNTATQSPKPTTVTKVYTLVDVSQHASENDCWVVIEDKIYNATAFIAKHPGGKTILNGCGKDATKLFNERPTNNKGPHPDAAGLELKKLYIGDLKK